jgi:hypothetical protein
MERIIASGEPPMFQEPVLAKRAHRGHVAAARALGCRELYSEDMTHDREIDGVTIIEPFR